MLRKIARRSFVAQRGFSQSVYGSQMFQRWQTDKQSVDPVWQDYFDKHPQQKVDAQSDNLFGLYRLIKEYQLRGNEVADLDPLSTDLTQICT